MIFIDANVFLAYANENDVHHKAAVRLWDDIVLGKYGRAFMSDYVFSEVVGVALRRRGKTEAETLGNHILKSVFTFYVDESVFVPAWEEFSSSTLPLSFVDWMHVIIMMSSQIEHIATFDKAFKEVKGITVVD